MGMFPLSGFCHPRLLHLLKDMGLMHLFELVFVVLSGHSGLFFHEYIPSILYCFQGIHVEGGFIPPMKGDLRLPPTAVECLLRCGYICQTNCLVTFSSEVGGRFITVLPPYLTAYVECRPGNDRGSIRDRLRFFFRAKGDLHG